MLSIIVTKVFHNMFWWLDHIYSKLLTNSFLYHNQGINTEKDDRIGCKAPGNPRCNPATWLQYSNGCCSEEEKCTINEGDCNVDADCHGSLVCKPNSCRKTSHIPFRQFHPRASCCQQPSGALLTGL